jgi:hypothetical protein
MTMYTETHAVEIELEDDILEVEFTGELSLENDGIGSYEYWGAKFYDAGTNYFQLQDLTWDTTQYTDEQNKAIQEYVDNSDNWSAIEEKMSESLFENMGPDEPDYEPDDCEPDYDAEFGGVDW